MKQRILVLGDIHFPYANERALKWAVSLVRELKPTRIVQIGDLYDQYSFSRFTRRNLEMPEQELSRARDKAVLLWRTLTGSGARCYQILGNHDLRIIKRAQERLPEAQKLVQKSVLELYRFKGVITVEDDRDELKIGNISFHHGYLSRLGDHMRLFGASTVVGHSHTGGVVFEQRNGEALWELNAGYLADETSEPLRYRPTKTSKWTLGVGFIDTNGPRFIPYKGGQ